VYILPADITSTEPFLLFLQIFTAECVVIVYVALVRITGDVQGPCSIVDLSAKTATQ